MIRYRKQLKLTQNDINYIDNIADEYELNSSYATSKIISEHKREKENNNYKNLYDKLDKILKGINKISMQIDIQNELINSLCIKFNLSENDFIPLKDHTAVIFSAAQNEVKKNIAALNISLNSKVNGDKKW